MKRPSRKTLPRRAKRARFASDPAPLFFDSLPPDVVAYAVSFVVGPPRDLATPKCKLPPPKKEPLSPVSSRKDALPPLPDDAQPHVGAPPQPQINPLRMPIVPPPTPAHMRPLKAGGRPDEALANMAALLDTGNLSLKLACSMNFASVVEVEPNSLFTCSSSKKCSSSASTDTGEVLLSTSGTKQYKNLNTVCKSLGGCVTALKFEDKHITKRYSQIARRYCPNLRSLTLTWGCMFAAWRTSFHKMGAQLEEMLAAVTPLDKLQVEICECSQSHIDAIGKFSSSIKHIVLNIKADLNRNSLGIQSLMPIYNQDESSILKKFDIHVPEKLHDADELKLDIIHVLCPKVEITLNGLRVGTENAE